ncbi:hypothetical protein B0T26DRAFT_641897 [Lasiosphaeria miniovina]|uniref:ATPase synthesis protein 25 n=1 Tax=Lasiosphaeria miniovina TaxID=1954250 RepID=A0AA40ATH2_9PEZI|nr:uncharacterized protein B0T26DRAFT_641897 [Lasiosphaeria miniovina]KAK0721710.1 hypothetical protein B0T26DRAFT_641897 [Lasiosphaeria miniovina]
MGVALRAVGSSACSACRLSAPRLFAGHISALRAVQAATRQWPATPANARFSSFRATPRLQQPSIEEVEEEKVGNDVQEPASGPNGDDVPWYLQVEPPRHPTLLHEPPPLPEIPESSPKLMEPLLKFAAEELGLDELSLLDLRELDPAPALGPDLMMLFGSARSERHLHVSADRLVRWLRGRGITAQADGLLGRNELKTRLRRKARKAKLLGKTGGGPGEDDGISTGWICVNLGTLGRSDQEVTIYDETGAQVGFGVPQLGTTVVVQIMTESRREELSLEKLWSGKLKRSLEKNQPEQEIEAPGAKGPGIVGGSQFAVPSRFFSTSSRQLDVPAVDSTAIGEIISSGRQAVSMEEMSELLMTDVESKLHVLSLLKQYAESLNDHTTALDRALVPFEDGAPSAFLSIFNRAISGLSPSQALEHRLWLETLRANNLSPFYSNFEVAKALVKELQSGPEISRENCIDLIRLIYTHGGKSDEDVRQQSILTMEVIDTMSARGEKVLDNDVVGTVIESLLRHGRKESPEVTRLLRQFEDLFAPGYLPCPSEALLVRLLDAYSAQGDWGGFWKTWRIPPRFLQPRSGRMYAYLFHRFAADNNQKRATYALRWTVDEMTKEQPPVLPRGRLLEALKACILCADPTAVRRANQVKMMPTMPREAAGEFPYLLLKLDEAAETDNFQVFQPNNLGA